MKKFEDYKQEVIEAYKKKKQQGTLSPNLLLPTTTKLKRECIEIFTSRYSQKDRYTITAMFREEDDTGNYIQMLRNCNPDIFRPLNKFLRNELLIGTNNKNIELLAWLIDFEPRPYHVGDIYAFLSKDTISNTLPETVSNLSDEHIISSFDQQQIETQEETSASTPTSYEEPGILGTPRKYDKTLKALFATILVITGLYISYRFTRPECMYWNGERYQTIACNEKIYGTPVMKIDTARYDHLSRISNISSITRDDIGKVHYSKIDGEVQFYTTSGTNPTDTNKRLLPMTEYMYEKYVLKKNLQ